MTHCTPTVNRLVQHRSLFLHGLGWFMGFGMLGGGVTLAQSPAAIDEMPASAPVPKAAVPASSVIPQLSGSASGEVAPQSIAPQPIAPSAASGAYIDRTDYNLGATRRYEPPAIARPALPAYPQYSQRPRYGALASSQEPASAAPVRVGPLNLSANGVSWNSGNAAPVGQGYSTVQNYYNRTVRPIGRVGNGDLKLLFPLALPAPITSLFGWRVHPITGDSRIHAGTDLGSPLGTPVLAALTGRVIMADFFGGYGLSVALEHRKGEQQTLYAHLSELFVKPGDVVKQGSVIGRVGNTGASTGPHLHFEFRQQTREGWVAMDAGLALESAMAQLVKNLQVAQATSSQTRTQ